MIKELDIKIGALIKQERILRGLSQAELGKALGVTFQQIQKYEKGANRLSLSSLLEILSFMKISPADFINKLLVESKEILIKQDLSGIREFIKLPLNVRKKVILLVNTITEGNA